MMGVEPTTTCLGSKHSTTELHPQNRVVGHPSRRRRGLSPVRQGADQFPPTYRRTVLMTCADDTDGSERTRTPDPYRGPHPLATRLRAIREFRFQSDGRRRSRPPDRFTGPTCFRGRLGS